MLCHLKQRLARWVLLPILALLPTSAFCQETSPSTDPVRPSPPSTTARSPRGVDIVEPMRVYKVSRFGEGRADTTYLGLAKIPDPRRNEEGATTRRDVDSGILIRFGDAWIIDRGGLRRVVPLDPAAQAEELLFEVGRHDVVTSRQGVAPATSVAGRLTTFDLEELYEAANLNPLSGQRLEAYQPRIALLKMESTYPGGEAVDLAVPLTRLPLQPDAERQTQATQIAIERRDTSLIVRPRVVMRPPGDTTRLQPRVAVLAQLESGYGSSLLHAGIPATTTAPFTSSGYADAYYIDGSVLLDRIHRRWRLDVYGASYVANTGITRINDHMVALQAALRFEYGRTDYVVLEARGQMADKQYQEFDWNSADYAGMLMIGRGYRSVNRFGLENRRMELMFGLRMGEHREIEVFQSNRRARGLGPVLSGEYDMLHSRPRGLELYLRAAGTAYGLVGRGDRDEGFRELGVRLEGEVTLGREILGMFVYARLNNIWRTEHAWLPDDYHYLAYRVLLVPGFGVQMRL